MAAILLSLFRARTVLGRLRKRYGELVPPRRTDPLEELVLTVLSQHTSDVNADRAFRNLRATFPTWEDVVRAPTGAVADAIRSGGLADTKAPRIQAILEEILDRRGAFDLTYLGGLSDEEARQLAEAGVLAIYGPDLAEAGRRAARYVQRILRGAKPGDLPIEQATKFDLVVNLKTAAAIGLDVPARVIARADDVIR